VIVGQQRKGSTESASTLSLRQAFANSQRCEELVLVGWGPVMHRFLEVPPMKQHPRSVSSRIPIISFVDTPEYAQSRLAEKLTAMNLVKIDIVEDMFLLHFSTNQSCSDFSRVIDSAWLVSTDLDSIASLRIDPVRWSVSQLQLLSDRHAIVEWICRVRDFATAHDTAVRPADVRSLWRVAIERPYHLNEIMAKWDEASTIPSEMKPPRDKDGDLVRFELAELISHKTITKDD